MSTLLWCRFHLPGIYIFFAETRCVLDIRNLSSWGSILGNEVITKVTTGWNESDLTQIVLSVKRKTVLRGRTLGRALARKQTKMSTLVLSEQRKFFARASFKFESCSFFSRLPVCSLRDSSDRNFSRWKWQSLMLSWKRRKTMKTLGPKERFPKMRMKKLHQSVVERVSRFGTFSSQNNLPLLDGFFGKETSRQGRSQAVN